MSILDRFTGNVQNKVERVTGMADQEQAPSFSRDFQTGSFDSFGGDVTSGKMTEIARFQVPSDTKYSWGYGSADKPENQGYLYVDLRDGSSNAVDGVIQLVVESSTTRETEVVKEIDTERLDASKTDRQQQVALPEQISNALATEDAYLVVNLDPSADDTVDETNSEVILPVTEYDLSQA